jgi:hypothetical protein
MAGASALRRAASFPGHSLTELEHVGTLTRADGQVVAGTRARTSAVQPLRPLRGDWRAAPRARWPTSSRPVHEQSQRRRQSSSCRAGSVPDIGQSSVTALSRPSRGSCAVPAPICSVELPRSNSLWVATGPRRLDEHFIDKLTKQGTTQVIPPKANGIVGLIGDDRT